MFSFDLHSRWVHSKFSWSRSDVGSSRSTFSFISSTREPYSASFQTFWCHPHVPIRIILVFDEQKDIPNAVLSPIQVPTKLLRTVSPTRDQKVGVGTNFVQEEPLDHRCLTMISATCVVEDVSIYLDSLTLEFWAIWERPPIFTRVYADTASAACPSQSGNLAITSITFPAVICDADEPCSVKTAWTPESSFTLSPRSTTLPLYFCSLLF